MKTSALRIVLPFIVMMFLPPVAWGKAEKSPAGIVWQGWSEKLFDRAHSENRFILLDLEAVWCHWCHVMEEKTYSDPDVRRLIEKYYYSILY